MFVCPVLVNSLSFQIKRFYSFLLFPMPTLQKPETVCQCQQGSENSTFPFPTSSRSTSYAGKGLCFPLMAALRKVRAHSFWLSRSVCRCCKTLQVVVIHFVSASRKLLEVSLLHWSNLLLGEGMEADMVPFGQTECFHTVNLCGTAQCPGKRHPAFIWVVQCMVSPISGS